MNEINSTIINNTIFKKTRINNYWVSENGDIINMNNKTLKIMKPMKTEDNHLRIELKIGDGTAKKFYIHRLVYEAFVGELIEGLVIEHLDGNPKNNNYKNLKQSTQKENIRTAINQKTFGKSNIKPIGLLDKDTRILYWFDKVSKAVSYVGLTGDSVYRLKRSSRINKKYEIVECSKKGQTTIETVISSVVDMSNGVEYTVGENPAVEVHGILKQLLGL